MPTKDKDDTYDAKGLTDVIKSTAGESITIKQLPDIITGTNQSSSDKTRAAQLWAEWSTKWFALSNCEINDSGEVVYKFNTDKTKKTPAGRVVRIGLYFSAGEEVLVHRQPNKVFWYQLT